MIKKQNTAKTKQQSIDDQGGIIATDNFGKYFPSVKQDLSYKGMLLLLKKKSKQVSTAAQITGGIKQVTEIKFIRQK